MDNATKLLFGCVLVTVTLSAFAGTTTWNGLGDATNWLDAANWGSGLPGTGDDAVINSGTVLLTNSTPNLSS